MATNPCKICGSTDLHLVDGFYYCVECGTQDVNARETVVEQTLLADGTFAHTTIKKYKTVLQDSIEMGGEWHKWHAYNFILSSLTDELLALGAAPTVKTKVMWIWVRYIKKFQIKDDKENNNNFDDDSISDLKNNCEDSNITSADLSKESLNSKRDTEKFRRDINIVTKGTLLAILYVALNLDRSDIQLSHLFRFIREGRLSLYTCTKYVPKELSTKAIPHWMSFIKCQNEYTPKVIRAVAMTFFKRLDLGVPLVPDLNKIITNYTKELCLPEDFRTLVLSLMHLVPCDYLALDSWSGKKLVRVPDYEGTCMAYILVTLKLCFGLDGEYELKLSDEIDKINYDENHLRSYKLGAYSESSDRLLSFREWYTFLQFRKTILCKYYLPMARQMHMPIDDAVLMDHLEKRSKRKPKLSDEVTMDILNKIVLTDEKVAVPKKEFPATLTPMTSYTDVILEYIQDPDFRLLMCEDFSQYSIKYATRDLKLPGYDVNKSLKGVGKGSKVINHCVVGTLQAKKGDTTMVFVRNCENKNWLKTKPPKVEHVVELNNKGSNDIDQGYGSTTEITDGGKDLGETLKEELEDEIEFETVDIEDSDKSIFDDDFLDMKEDEKRDDKSESNENIFEFINNGANDFDDSKIDLQENIDYIKGNESSASDHYFDPETFDRNKAIQELVDIVCKKYKIPKPREKNPRAPQKRKNMLNDETGVSEPKKTKPDDKEKKRRSEARMATKELVAAYYKNIEQDVLLQVSEHVKSIIRNNEETNNVSANESGAFEEPVIQEENNIEQSIEDSFVDKDPNVSVISSIHPNFTMNGTLNEENDTNNEDDPNFDPKTHDINQLYVKFSRDTGINEADNILDIENDLDIEKIIEKKIDQFTNGEIRIEKNKNISINMSDSKEVHEEIINPDKGKRKQNYEKFLKTELKKFRYWMRHYRTITFVRCLDMNQKFDIELLENCPKSFIFVINECAAILDCTTFCLYKCMQNLETSLLAVNK